MNIVVLLVFLIPLGKQEALLPVAEFKSIGACVDAIKEAKIPEDIKKQYACIPIVKGHVSEV